MLKLIQKYDVFAREYQGVFAKWVCNVIYGVIY